MQVFFVVSVAAFLLCLVDGQPPTCPHGAREPCDADVFCRWDAAAGACAVRFCSLKLSAQACEYDSEVCNWNPMLSPASGGWCVDKACPLPAVACAQQATEAECVAGADCTWVAAGAAGGVCVTDYCPGTHADDGAACGADPRCVWQETVGGCDGEGRYAAIVSGKCVNGPCEVFDEPCACAAQQQCAWHGGAGVCVRQKHAGCPSMDLMVVLDGSKSQTTIFGAYPNGYKAAIAQLQGFSRGTPLTGGGVGQPPPAAGVRLGFVQFSGVNPTPGFWGLPPIAGESRIRTSQATQGQFSGAAGEVAADLDGLRVLFMGEGAMLEQALAHAAAQFASSAEDRARVLLVLVDGETYDEETYASRVATLEALNVTRFGMVVHDGYNPAQPHTLDSVVSSPAHLRYTHVDAIETALTDLCAAGGVLGSLAPNGHPSATLSTWHAALTCPLFPTQPACGGQAGCLWNAGSQQCAVDHCAAHCTAASCDSAAACRWDAGACAPVQQPAA
ncbi:hypothetical protein DIPPA_15694 [Diplonema papillatum]|nr:hypothetical protein DIPPA_15694 [Diplonema papillatum]|eukprot:gene17391-26725_t